MQEDEVKVTLIATGFDEKSKENQRLKENLTIPKEEDFIEDELSDIRIKN